MDSKWLIAVLVLVAWGKTSLSAQVLLNGKVWDDQKQGLFAANVYFKQFPEGGTTTDLEGNFQLNTERVQLPDTLIVSFIGFNDLKVLLSSIPATPLDLQLESSPNLLSLVQINSKRPITQEFSISELSKFDIYAIPFSFADPLKAITILPSSTNTEETADVTLRGSRGEQSVVTLNGVPIANPVRSTNLDGNGFFSIFNPELIQNLIVYPGNPPLTYGNSTAGLVEIEMVDQVDQNFTQFSAGLANLSVMHGRQLGAKATLHVYTNYQTSALFKSLNASSFDFLNKFRVFDLGAKLHARVGAGLFLDWFSYGLDEASSVNTEIFTHRDATSAQNRRNFHVARLMLVKNVWNFSANFGADFSRNNFGFGVIDNRSKNRRYYGALNAKLNVIGNWTLQAGMTTDYAETDFRNQGPEYYYALFPEAPATLNAGFFRNTNQEFYLLSKSKFFEEKLSIVTSTRKNIPTNELQKSYWSRQAIVKYAFNKRNALAANAGGYNGYGLPNAFNPGFRYINSRQYALEYEYRSTKLDIDAALFSKREGGDVFFSPDEIYAQRKIVGIESRLRWDWTKHLQFSASYSLLDVQNETPEGNQYPGAQDIAYFSRIFLTLNQPKWINASLAYVFRQGLLFSPATGGQFDPNLGVYEPLFENSFNTERLPAYHNLSLNLSREIPTKKHFLLVYANLNNIFNIRNAQAPIYASNYSRTGFDFYQQRSLYFGLVWKI